MTSQDLAAWVQAIGSVVGLFVVWRLARADSAQRDAEKAQESWDARALAILFGRSLMASIHELESTIASQHTPSLYSTRARFADLIEWARQIPLLGIPAGRAEAIVELRRAATLLHERVDSYTKS